MIAVKCDRCGKLYKALKCAPNIKVIEYKHPYGDVRYDLCPKCQKKLEEFLYGEQYGGFAEKIANITNIIPAADVQEVRHGDWLDVITTSYKNSEEGIAKKYYACSLCSIKNAIRSKYCPNCGAKMDKE